MKLSVSEDAMKLTYDLWPQALWPFLTRSHGCKLHRQVCPTGLALLLPSSPPCLGLEAQHGAVGHPGLIAKSNLNLNIWFFESIIWCLFKVLKVIFQQYKRIASNCHIHGAPHFLSISLRRLWKMPAAWDSNFSTEFEFVLLAVFCLYD